LDLSGNARRNFFACLPKVAPAATVWVRSLEARPLGTICDGARALAEKPDRLMVDISFSASLVPKKMWTSPFAKPFDGTVKLT
jgi:hypothetical protein